MVRLRVVDDEPMAIERLHLPHELVPGLVPADMETGSFYKVLRERFGVDVRSAVQTIEATVTDETEAELLGVPEHFPALLVERTTRDVNGRIVEFTRSIYRGDRYRVTVGTVFRLRVGIDRTSPPLAALSLLEHLAPRCPCYGVS